MNQAQMIKGILEGCVLRVVEDRFCYSQEMVNILRENGFPGMSSGTLFPLLLRLEKAGYFEVKMVPSAVGPSRKYYRLNQCGRAELTRFCTQWEELKQIVDGILKGDDIHEGEEPLERDV